MNPSLLRSWGIPTLTLAGLCALFVLILVLQRFLAGGNVEGSAVRVSAAGPGELSELETRRFDLPPETEYAVIAARPLFHEDRRPEQRDGGQQDGDAQLAEEQAPSEPPPVTLTGVIITPEARIAMMRNTESREYVTLKEGEPLEGWTLQKVQHRRIVFDSGGREQIVELDVYTGPAGQGRGGGDAPASQDGAQAQDGPQVIDSSQLDSSNSSAAQAIRERIERERERRRQLIEEARKRQQQSDGN